MTDHNPTVKARELLQESMSRRLAAVETAAQKARRHDELQQQMAAAEAEMDAAWKAALDAGWDERELKRIGLMKPGTRVRRPRAMKPRTENQPAESGGTQVGVQGAGDEGVPS